MSRLVRPVVTVHDEREAARHARGRVFVVDDDDAVRSAVTAVLSHEAYAVSEFRSAEDFLEQVQRADPVFPGPACLLLDLKMPGVSGLDLQQQLARDWPNLPIVFMSGGSSAGEAVQALKGGALDFLVKPFDDEQLMAAVAHALARNAEMERSLLSAQSNERRFAELSGRESQIARMVAAGLRNQQIADRLGIAERTVKLHRMHMMRKLGTTNLIDLVRLLDSLP